MASKNKKGDDSLRRPRNTRRERERILIVTEGERTETQYFKRLASYLRATGVTVDGLDVIGVGRDPMSVVRRAAKRTSDGKLVGQREGYDAVWCVFDVDEHVNLDDAVTAAKRFGFSVSVSNPCFEIWLLWHVEDRTKRISRTELARKVRQHGVDKTIPNGFPYQKYTDAITRAGRADGEVPGNPGSGVTVLAQRLDGTAP